MTRLGSVVATLAAVLGSGATASATDLFATEGSALFTLDTATGVVTPVGSPFVFTDPGNEFFLPFLARDPAAGTLYGLTASQVQSRIYSIDKTTGALTELHAIQSAPVDPLSATVDPTDGSIYYINQFGFTPLPHLNRWDPVSGKESHLGTIGPPSNQGDTVMGLVFDQNGQLFGLHHPTNVLLAIDKLDPTNNTGPVGSGLGGGLDFAFGVSLVRDEGTGTVFGFEVSQQRIFTVDLVNGTAQVMTAPIGTHLTGLADMDVPACLGSATAYGTGCPGLGGFVPELSFGGCPEPGENVSIDITDGRGGALTMILVGTQQANVPLSPNCALLLLPPNPFPLVNLGGIGPGNGSLSIVGVLPPEASGSSATLQALMQDNGVPLGFSATNGVLVTIP
jgi:hypothetical protein